MNVFSIFAVRLRWTSKLLAQDLLPWRGRRDFFTAFRERKRSRRRMFPIRLRRGTVFVDGQTAVIDLRALGQIFLDNVYGGLDLAGCVVIDIGAHKGYFAAFALLKDAKAVICYEPEASNFAALTLFAKTERKPGQTLELLNEAGGMDGFAELYISSDSWCHSTIPRDGVEISQTIRVPSRSLATILSTARRSYRDDPIVLKIDAEGAECPLLLHASSETLSGVREIIFEFHEFSKCLLQQLIESLTAIGFEYVAVVKEADLHHFRMKAPTTPPDIARFA